VPLEIFDNAINRQSGFSLKSKILFGKAHNFTKRMIYVSLRPFWITAGQPWSPMKITRLGGIALINRSNKWIPCGREASPDFSRNLAARRATQQALCFVSP
jgi:hypothetical protein